MIYGILVTLHLLCVIVFIGAVAFEVLMIDGVRGRLPAGCLGRLDEEIQRRARKIMPWVVGLLFLSGIAMVGVAHRVAVTHALTNPFVNLFGTLLSVKILLALSVLAHFVLAIRRSACGAMTSKLSRYIHLSVLFHMIAIVILAKGMFYIHW
ncbi:hypothetical protein O5O45_26460 [Hahella aquimaris]|uniref:CopD family copper resistance protein n=1 Tax=Hahella sp. HNIBRBA332 TaxID=3015983 RepID=UPI00273C4196|nr:hypothetical protein [Hahella sp. HNIBRBA332]WLQ13274.1 hypothetical protein O5O45_26460 [Hahella sp. HNIBRBA332]